MHDERIVENSKSSRFGKSKSWDSEGQDYYVMHCAVKEVLIIGIMIQTVYLNRNELQQKMIDKTYSEINEKGE